jgi:hypothetical protein
MVRTGVIILGVIIVALVVGMGTGVINLQNLNIGQPLGGVPQAQPTTVVGTEFSGELDVILLHFNTLNDSIQLQEGVARDILTIFYKSSDGVQFSSIGEGVQGLGGASRVTITPDMNSILYATSGVAPTPTAIYSDPVNTQLANERITDFSFEDVTNDGTKEWLYKIDLRGVTAPVAGQGASTISIITKSYTEGFPITLNSPANILNVGSDAGTVTFVRWELSVPQGTANPQTEYTIQIVKVTGAGGTEFWDVGQSTLDIPNLGLVSLADFDEQILTSTNTLYRMKIGDSSDFANANYVTTPQNGNTVHPIPFKIVTNLQDNVFNDNLDVTLTIKSLDKNGGSNTPFADTVRLDES